MRFPFWQLGFGIAVMTAGCCVSKGQTEARPVIAGDILLIESPQNPAAVKRVTDDLAADFAKVFGRTLKRAKNFSQAGPVVLWVSEAADVPAEIGCTKTVATESFAFLETSASG